MMATANTQTDISNEELFSLKNNNLISSDKLFNNLYKANKGLIKSLVYKYSGFINVASRQFYTINEEDIESEANLAFYDAVRKYDIGNEAKFSTYAYFLIECALKNLIKRKANITGDYKDEVTNETKSFMIVSLSAKYADDITLEDVIADENTDILEEVETNIKKDNVAQYLNRLNESEAEIIKSLFGIGCTERSGEDLAKEMNMSRQGVKYYKDKILHKLGKEMKKVEKFTLRA